MANFDYLDTNVASVRERIADAAVSCKRNADDILLLAAVKYASSEEINYISESLGIHDVGENRVNTMLEHYENTNREDLRYHFIGTLQKNKVKYVYDKIFLLHSLDSLSLADEIEKRCAAKDIVLDALIEVNIADEPDKGGVSPSELDSFAEALTGYRHINVKGFMTMAPAGCTKEEYKEYFTRAQKAFFAVWRETFKKTDKPFISMGMSGSLAPAIECGSTCVRIGRDIFSH